MSLKVVLINSISKEVINIDTDILVDELVSTIKEKLFAFNEGIEFYPNFTKLELESVVITEDNSIILLAKSDKDVKLQVSNIFHDMETIINTNRINIQTIFDPSDTTVFDNLLETVRREYTEITEEDFDFIIKLLLVQSNPVIYENFQKDIQEYIEIILEKREKAYAKYSNLAKGLNAYMKVVNSIKKWEDYFEGEMNYTNISLVIKSNNFETGVKGKFIKLDQIFNQLELDEQIPFITIARMGDPLVKIHNRLIENVSEKELRSWMLNEKKKMNVTTYKKVKGLVIRYKYDKSNYLSFNLQDNGLITSRIAYKEGEMDIDKEINKIKGAVDYVIEKINNLQGVFQKSRRIENTSNSNITIDALSGFARTTILIDKEHFMKELSNVVLSNYLFELKDTLSEDVLSLYYKKYGKKENDEYDNDRKGITVNIRDNPYKLNSSIINIFGAYSVNQMNVIMKQIVAVTKLQGKSTETNRQKIKEKSHIKDLRKQGVNILSTKCQKPRQPVVDPTKMPFENSYTLEYEGMKYVCPKKDYPYPGFTNENIVCCFKKDQRRRQAYTRNTKSKEFDIIVQPSNFKVKITQGQKTYETFVIKIISDYNEGFNEENAMTRYYYLSNENALEAITNDDVVKQIAEVEENNIWLEAVPLAKVVGEPPKNKCNFPPNLNSKKVEDINAACAHHKKNKIFGYNLNSYPCCFDKERDTTIKRKKKTFDVTKQHIFTSDKVLDYERIGVLPPHLDTLFHKIIGDKQCYRMGVTQNNSAFLNAVLMAMNNKFKGETVSNSNEFRKYIVKYLENNKTEYLKLNGGNLAMKFGNMDNYVNSILDKNASVYWNDYVDILQRICKINIILIDIPYKVTESTKIADYDNMKLICNPNVKIQKNYEYIVIIKRVNAFEIVIKIDDSTVEYKFKSKNLINVFEEYYNMSCVKEEVFPDEYPYDEIHKVSDIVNSLKDSELKITTQYVNASNKVVYIGTKNGVILPVKETGISNVGEVVKISQLNSENLLDIYEYINMIKDVNKQFKKQSLKQVEIRGVTIDIGKVNDVVYTSILTNFGQLVPVKRTPYDSTDNFIILDFKYYPDVDEYMFEKDTEHNEQKVYYETILKVKDTLYEIKKELGEYISKDDNVKESLIEIILSKDMHREDKIRQIVEIFKNVLTASEGELQQIANEVLNDNIENLLLNNLITKESFNPNEVTSRDTEAVLTNINEIQTWFKKHKRSEI
jgi:hypothetical protein